MVYTGIHQWEMDQSAKLVAQEMKETEAGDLQQSATFVSSISDTEAQNSVNDYVLPEQLDMDGQTYALKDNLDTLLVIGLDKNQEDVEEEDAGEYSRNHQQADFIVLIVCDPDTQSARLLQINRDTMADITELGLFGDETGTLYEQLCLAHTFGTGNRDSAKNTRKAVSAVLGGAQIDHYVTLTMDAVAGINDALGGVEVEMLDDFSSDSPLTAQMIQGETVTLNGEQALRYVRARANMIEPTNVARMERQAQYMTALFEKMKSINTGDGQLILDLINNAAPYMTSDCSINTLSAFLNEAMQYASGQIETIDGEAREGENAEGTVNTQFFLDPEALEEKVVSLFYEPVVQPETTPVQ